MWTTIKDMLTSKKFLTLLAAVGSSLLAAVAGQIGWDAALQACGAMVITYIGAQGLADFGKSAAQVNYDLAVDDTAKSLAPELGESTSAPGQGSANDSTVSA